MHPNHRPTSAQQRRVRRHVEGADSYAFFNLLTGPQMLENVEELLPDHRERLFPPTETLSMFLAQALSSDGSCRQAVNDAALKRIVDGLPRCSASTSAFCQARQRLPQEMISALTRQTGDLIADAAPQAARSRSSESAVLPDIFRSAAGASACFASAMKL